MLSRKERTARQRSAGQTSEISKSEVREEKSEVSSQKGRRQRTQGRRQRSASQKSERRSQRSVVRKAEGGDRRVESEKKIRSAKDLTVYKKAYELAMMVFNLSKLFPDVERYALTSQIRRSSRSVCLNLREAWAKRRYEAHFISKLTDCDGENSETDSSLDFAYECRYITEDQHAELKRFCEEIGKMLGRMIKDPSGFLTSDR
jgi:four helix bundle protein